jgi:nitronate monooxygenase
MNRLRFLDIPIVAAPMFGASTPAMAAAVSNEGGLGSIAGGYLQPEAIRAAIRETRSLTSRPFAVNLFVTETPRLDERELEEANRALQRYRDELGLERRDITSIVLPTFEEQMRVVFDERPAVFSFTFGVPPAAALARCRDEAIFTIGTATSVDEARALEAAGVDAVCAQGYEAGGHRGAFLHDDDRGLIGTIALVPQIVDAVEFPVIAAGGIGDGRGIAAVLALGACAAQVGSAFLLASEASTSPPWRAMIETHTAHTTLTKVFSGRAARGIDNRFVQEMREAETIAPYPLQNALTRDIRDAASKAGNAELISAFAGQAVALARRASSAEIVRELMREAAEASRRTYLGTRARPRRC